METLISLPAVDTSVLQNAMNWRYATKIFDKNRRIPDHIMDTLLEVLRLSPSSIGLQPWKFINIKDGQKRRELKDVSLGQSQITDASDLLLLCSFNDMDISHVDKLIAFDREVCKNDRSAYADFRPHAVDYINGMSRPALREWMAEQCYIALGFLLSACAMLRVDACPIEAFDRDKANQILQLDRYGVNARTLVALGYRSENDHHAHDKKVRFNSEDVLITI